MQVFRFRKLMLAALLVAGLLLIFLFVPEILMLALVLDEIIWKYG